MGDKELRNLLTERLETLCKEAKDCGSEDHKNYSSAILMTVQAISLLKQT